MSALKRRLRRPIKTLAFRVGRPIPVLRALLAELKSARDTFRFVPAGHYYSPIPSPDAIREHAARSHLAPTAELPGIFLNERRQLELLDTLKLYYRELPFPELKTAARTYFFENPAYSYSDAICLYGMIRHVRPRRIIEVGSGYSSCVILDTNELFFDNQIECTFIDPYPERLQSLIRKDDDARIAIVPTRVQDVDLARFRELAANDILLTHVAKIGRDVNHIIANILPALRAGVYIHFHDIIYPFEYPLQWLEEGRVWPEAYLLRAFLAFNSVYDIVLFNTFLERFYRDEFVQDMPLCLKNEGGSIWLQRRPDRE